MLQIRAVSFNGRPVGRELLATFGEAGGTIGRGENSTLVLPDPERFISRTHASISFQAGGFVITDNSTKNPIILNGRPMGPGSQARLGNGDQIQLGGYLLAVAVTALRSAPPTREEEPGTVRESVPSGAPSKDDPWAVFKGSRPNAPDPFADLLKPKPPTPPQPAIPPGASARPDPLADLRGPAAGTPDPFADLLKPKPSASPEPAVTPGPPGVRPDPLADLQGREPSIDDVLGLKPSGGLDPLRPVRFPDQPGATGIVDPLEVLGGAAKPVPPPTVPDHGQEIFTPYVPPAAKADPGLQARPDAVIPVTPSSREGVMPASPPIRTDPAAPARSEVVAAPPPPLVPPARVEAPARPADHAAADADVPALLQAFLRGAGIPETPLLARLTPETMESIGKVLREAVQGTLDLLRARGLTKSEMRADVTMIMPVDNNPLKFSPTVEAAMVHLLAPHVQGFMTPLRAMTNAYDDLRAHELGVLAGMRAALDEVLGRFAPAELTRRLSDPTLLDNLLAVNRKAKQWDLFVERYEAVAEEAREDFHAAFGKAFRRAYEAQVKQLREEERRGP